MEFKRMLSWQLSTPREEPPKKSKKKRKKQEPKSETDSNSEDDDIEHVVVNSNGEEEKYYSAPESPLSSDEDPAVGTSALRDEIRLPPQEPGRSNRSKKRRRYAVRKARAEFFQPLCDLIETKLFVETGAPDVKSFNEVPTLVELCLRAVKQGPKEYAEDELPFLLRSLLSHDRQLKSTVTSHVRWLEKLLAAYEVWGSIQGWGVGENAGKEFQDHAYQLQMPWNLNVDMVNFPAPEEGLHCPLPIPTTSSPVTKAALMRPLFHFANYFYPLLAKQDGVAGATSPLTLSQLSAIRHVNKFLRLRYPCLTGVLSESVKLWPAYVYWARGNPNLSASVFSSAVELLTEDVDRCVALNELARMLVMFGDRSSAWRHFRRSAELAEGIFKDRFGQDPHHVGSCSWALQCATGDTGWLDQGAARQSAQAWDQLLKLLPAKLRVLHMAACESRMVFHCGHPIAAGFVGTKEEEGMKWLRECEDLLMTCADTYPLLYYHLAQIRAMMGLVDASLRAYSRFVMDYAGFKAWDGGRMPGRLFAVGIPTHLSAHPWQPLLDLLASQHLPTVPLLSPQWRTTLLHPRYPYGSDQPNRVADHSPEDIGLRLTADGYLTADICMDLPPIRTVLLDPYTGSLCFSQKASLQHYWLSQTTDYYTLPHPLRLFESEHCVVELVMASSLDAEISSLPTPNYLAVMHWYGSDGSHHRLDIRKLIRQHLKQAILDLVAHRTKFSGNKEYLETMMEQGMKLDIQYLNLTKPPEKYLRIKSEGGSKKEKTKKKKKAPRNVNVHDFYLFLSSHVVYGDCTLMLSFCLEHYARTNVAEVLMFVNCSDAKSFLDAKVYCVGDDRGFSDLFPSPTMAKCYPNRHLKHVRYAAASCSEKRDKVVFSRVIINEQGMVVRREEDQNVQFPLCLIAGPRQITWTRGDQGDNDPGMLMSVSLDLANTQIQDAFPIIETVVVVPGIVFVATPLGVALLHPESLQPLVLKGLSSKVVTGATSESRKWYQFWGNGLQFNVLKVYDVDVAMQSSSDDFGSGTVVFAVNDRLVVLHVMPGTSSVEVVLDVQLPGEVTDFHPVGKQGYIITASQYHDHCREDLYWISESGKLHGMLPCLGHGSKSFCSAVLEPVSAEAAGSAQIKINPTDTGGLYVFFNDGLGGISCIRPQ